MPMPIRPERHPTTKGRDGQRNGSLSRRRPLSRDRRRRLR
jgi:hypothetical protein